MIVTFLGTGTSHGIPVIGCSCRVCTSRNPKNTRWRSAVHIREGKDSLLIDTPQELRLQVIRAGITNLTGVLYTHGHADHLFGIDDLRVFSRTKPLPVYADKQTLEEIRSTFAYIFKPQRQGGGIPDLLLKRVEHHRVFAGTHRVIPVPVYHGRRMITGYRIGGFAYITDCSQLPEMSRKLLADLDVLVIGALRYRRHVTHYSVEEALEIIDQLSPRIAYFTHMCHDIEHQELEDMLPDTVRPAYDGLSIQI